MLCSIPSTIATGQRAEQKGHHGRHAQREGDRDPRRPSEIQSTRARVERRVAEHEARDSGQQQLGQRDHPGVRGQEDDRHGDQSQDQRLGHHEVDEEVRAERGQQEEQHDHRRKDESAWAEQAAGAHAGRPNRP